MSGEPVQQANITNGSEIMDYSELVTNGDTVVIPHVLSTILITVISLMVVFGKCICITKIISGNTVRPG